MSSNEFNTNQKETLEGEGNYLAYRLYGFSNLTINNNYKYIINNEFIKNIIISDNVEIMTVELQDDIEYTKNQEEIESFLNHICFNIIIKTEADIFQPLRVLKVIKIGSSNIKMNDSIKMKDIATFKRSCSAKDFYDSIVKSKTSIDRNFVKYERIFKTLHNPNLIAQFMSLYQFLMELLSKGKSKVEQKNVVQYIKNNKHRYNWVYFNPTSRIGCNFDEDCFTYIRNQIGHSEETNDLKLYKQLGTNITPELIKKLLIIINDVIIEA